MRTATWTGALILAAGAMLTAAPAWAQDVGHTGPGPAEQATASPSTAAQRAKQAGKSPGNMGYNPNYKNENRSSTWSESEGANQAGTLPGKDGVKR